MLSVNVRRDSNAHVALGVAPNRNLIVSGHPIPVQVIRPRTENQVEDIGVNKMRVAHVAAGIRGNGHPGIPIKQISYHAPMDPFEMLIRQLIHGRNADVDMDLVAVADGDKIVAVRVCFSTIRTGADVAQTTLEQGIHARAREDLANFLWQQGVGVETLVAARADVVAVS